MSQIENLVTPLKANEKDESKREIDDKKQTSFNMNHCPKSTSKPLSRPGKKGVSKAKQLRIFVAINDEGCA